MSSPQSSNLRYLKDISFFIRNTYSHTISLQKSLLGEVTLGTLKAGKNVIAFEPHEKVSSKKKASQGANGINLDLNSTDNCGNDNDNDDESQSNNCTDQSICLVSHEKHVIKVWDKMMLHQLKNRMCENPLIEIEIMQRLCSGTNCYPYFVKFVNAFEDYLSYCTIMEYVPAGDLCNYVQQHGAFEFERARRYAKQTALAVAYLHKHGYCHLDLSLENLLLDQTTDTIKLCDFGLCRKLLPNQKPFEASFMPPGKKSYMAPEVYNHSPFFGDKADIFSLGVVFFILLAGFPPFEKPCLTDPCFRHLYEKDINIVLEKWQLTHAIPPQCADLLNKIFVPDVKRISMEEILVHPFWAGMQCNDMNIHVSSEIEMKEEMERNRLAAMHDHDEDTLQTIADDCSNIGNTTSDESELKLSNSSSRATCQDSSESKFENEERQEVDVDYSIDCPSLNLDFQFSKHENATQHGEIRKRTVVCECSDDNDAIEENIMDGIWNIEIQSDTE